MQKDGSDSYMFDLGHKMGNYNYTNLVLVMYLDLNLECLPPFGGDVVTFFVETSAVNLNPYQYTGSDTHRMFYDMLSW